MIANYTFLHGEWTKSVVIKQILPTAAESINERLFEPKLCSLSQRGGRGLVQPKEEA